jgi:uncharacterized membrane protein YgcG
MRYTIPLPLVALAVLLLAALPAPPARAQEETGWVITSFDASYSINPDGTVATTEDILVDFGTLERHGIFRDIPVEYEYDDENNRLIELTGISVDDGSSPHPFQIEGGRPNVRIRIGDPDVLVTGVQRYRIHYTINRGLNPFPDHDEFYWNVTGNEWPVPVAESSATVSLSAPGIERITCFQGPTGSTFSCDDSNFDPQSAVFTNGSLSEFAGLTVVVGLEKGVVAVEPPELVDASESVTEAADNFLGLSPIPIIGSLVLGFGLIALVIRQWWIAGRDRWYGDMSHAGGTNRPARKPLFAHETIVTRFTPPEVDGATPARLLRPAEIGLLVDERADTLDVTATIVDLAVRKHLTIAEQETGGILGLFKKKDYELQRLEAPADELLPYESTLVEALFETGSPVKLSDLEDKFYKDLAEVKERLVKDVTSDLDLFSRSPEDTRRIYRWAGSIIAAIGVILVVLFGQVGIGILAVPVVVAGALLLLLAPLMPRRTANGREMYRLALGFRRYIETAETERQKFAERENLFEEYLPYAIVFQCVDKWAKAFEDLGEQVTRPSWYSGRGPFMASAFASNVNDFSESISSVMASTPGGKGGSGFGGGGGSGGGGGGGGGGSW